MGPAARDRRCQHGLRQAGSAAQSPATDDYFDRFQTLYHCLCGSVGPEGVRPTVLYRWCG